MSPEEDFRLDCPVVEYRGALFHGTPSHGAWLAVTDGFQPQSHGEIDEGDYLSVSRNEEVLRMFSDGEGHTGFVFEANFKAVRLSDFYTALLASSTGMDLWDDIVKADPSHEARARNLGYLDRFGVFSRTAHWLNATCDKLYPEHDGFILPGFDSEHPRHEAEMALNWRGCAKLPQFWTSFYLCGDDLTPNEARTKLQVLHGEEMLSEIMAPIGLQKHLSAGY